MAVIITKSEIVCHIDTKLSNLSDGNLYIVRETGFSSESEKTAINNGLAYIRKRARKLLRLLNRNRPKGTPVYTSLPRLVEPETKPKRVRTIPPKQKRIRTVW